MSVCLSVRPVICLSHVCQCCMSKAIVDIFIACRQYRLSFYAVVLELLNRVPKFIRKCHRRVQIYRVKYKNSRFFAGS